MQPKLIENRPPEALFEKVKEIGPFQKKQVFKGSSYKLKMMVQNIEPRLQRAEFFKSLLALIFTLGIAWSSSKVRTWWHEGTTGKKRELVYLKTADSKSDIKTQKLSSPLRNTQNAKILFEEGQFYVELNGEKKAVDFNDYQKYLLDDFRKLTPSEKIAACNIYQELIGKIEKAWKEKKGDEPNDFVRLWKKELEELKKLAFEEEKSRNDYLVKEGRGKGQLVENEKAMLEALHNYSVDTKSISHPTIRQIIPLKHLLGPEKEYKNREAPIYKNIEALIRGENLQDSLFVGVRGDGNCTLRAFGLGLLMKAAEQGNEKLKEVLEKLGIEVSESFTPQDIVKDFALSPGVLEPLLLPALRKKIADHYADLYQTDLEIRARVVYAAAEKLQVDQKLDFVDPASVNEKDIQDWLEAFRNPTDEQMSQSYVFANEKDLCCLCQALECDLSYYSVSNVLVTRYKRDQEGQKVVQKTAFVPAVTTEGRPIMQKDRLGQNTKSQAEQTKIDYQQEKVASYTARHFHDGIESAPSPSAICMFNRGGAHSDLLIKPVK